MLTYYWCDVQTSMLIDKGLLLGTVELNIEVLLKSYIYIDSTNLFFLFRLVLLLFFVIF